MDIEHFEIARRLAFDMENEYRRLGLDPSYRLDDDLFKNCTVGTQSKPAECLTQIWLRVRASSATRRKRAKACRLVK